MASTAAVTSEKPTGPRSSKGARTRARLLEAAKEVFEESGFLEARISDIAERAELSQGAFYHYFESKEEIFREVAESLEDQLSTHSIIESELLDTSPGLTMRDRIRDSNSRFLNDYLNEARIMGVIEQVSRYDEQVRAARYARFAFYLKQTELAIKGLQRRDLADPKLDPKIAAAALAAMVSRFAEMWFVQKQLDCTLDEGIEGLTTLCMNALQLRDWPVEAPRSRRK